MCHKNVKFDKQIDMLGIFHQKKLRKIRQNCENSAKLHEFKVKHCDTCAHSGNDFLSQMRRARAQFVAPVNGNADTQKACASIDYGATVESKVQVHKWVK